jgi:hypothetical protein
LNSASTIYHLSSSGDEYLVTEPSITVVHSSLSRSKEAICDFKPGMILDVDHGWWCGWELLHDP